VPGPQTYGTPLPTGFVPYLLDTATNIVCSPFNPEPSGERMSYDHTTNSITFEGDSSNRYVAWYNAPLEVGTGDPLFRFLEIAGFTATVTNNSYTKTSLFVNDIQAGPTLFAFDGNVNFSLCGDGCQGTYFCDCYAGQGNGNQSSFRQGSIIDIECSAPSCGCLGSGDKFAYLFEVDIFGNRTGVQVQPVQKVDDCFWGANFSPTDRFPNGIGFYANSRQYPGSIEFFINPSGSLPMTPDDVAPYHNTYIKDNQTGGTFFGFSDHLCVIEGVMPYYTPSLASYLASCEPCLFAPSFISAPLSPETCGMAISEPAIVLSPYPDRLYVPSTCGNCTTVSNTLFFNLENFSWTAYDCLPNPVVASGVMEPQTIPLQLSGYQLVPFQVAPQVFYDSASHLGIFIGSFKTFLCGDPSGTFGYNLFIDHVSLQLSPCGPFVQMDFSSISTSGDVPIGPGLPCFSAISSKLNIDAASIVSCDPFVITGNLPCIPSVFESTTCGTPSCIGGQNSPFAEFNNISFSIIE
jgi:hypothetical protein